MGGSSAFAQFSSGVDGTVVDTSGAVVPGAHITITNTQLGVSNTTTSSDSGYFRIDKIAASTYTVEIAKGSFKTWVKRTSCFRSVKSELSYLFYRWERFPPR